MLASLLLAVPPALGGQGPPPPYHARGMDCWDYWYARDGTQYYAFYDQTPAGDTLRFDHAVIGMATSTDLAHWSEYGQVLGPGAPADWDRLSVATGSTWRCQDRWMMLYTGHSPGGQHGIGLASSDDLRHWTKYPNNPLPLVYFHYRVPVSSYWQGQGFPADTVLDYRVAADPYVLPTPLDGWYYMVVDCLLDHFPIEQRGCVGLFRTRDGVNWEDRGLITAPLIYAELEVPQVWNRGSTWYLLFGGANKQPMGRATVLYTSNALEGPFVQTPRPQIALPDDTPWFYCAKVQTDPRGQDVLLANTAKAVTHPFPVEYEADGSITLLPYSATPTGWAPSGVAGIRGMVVPDGVGGVISNGTARVNANGQVVWGPSPGAADSRWTSDGRGGAIGTWWSAGCLYASRRLTNGTRPWSDIALVCNPSEGLIDPVVVSDGRGGAVFAWLDGRNTDDLDVYAQHVDSLGRTTWTSGGVGLCVIAGDQLNAVIAPDGAGGAIVAWNDARPGAVGGSDVYAQRIDASGAVRWGTTGALVCGAAGTQLAPTIASDGAGGAIIAWWDARGGPFDVDMQRVDADGVPQWVADGIPIATARSDQTLPVLVADGSNGVFMAWEDHRPDSPEGTDVYAQHVRGDGALDWDADGVAVSTDLSAQTRPSIVADPAGGIVVAWMDARNSPSGSPYTFEPYVQRLDASGVTRWTLDGVEVAVGPGTATPKPPSIASDGAGGVFVDGPNGLQRVLGDGRPAWVPNYAPVIEAVVDAPNDEGGFVRITIDASLAEAGGLSPPVVMYQLLRQIPGANIPAQWELITTFVPTRQPTYIALAPTHGDSTTQGSHDDTFSVTAITANPTLVVASEPESGHSIDNLAPGPPQKLVGDSLSATTVRLAWSPRPEPDFWHYNVYRGEASDFPPSQATLIGEPVEPAWVDASRRVSDHYKVTAVDRHGNESPPSLLTPAQIGNRPSPRIPSATYLGGIAPNPVRSAARVEYGVARTGRYELGVYDLSGRRVRWLVNGMVAAGVRQAPWDATDDSGRLLRSGVYWVRLTGDGIDQSRRVALEN